VKSFICGLLLAPVLTGQTAPSFRGRVQAIISRPEYRHSRFGMEFYSLETGRALFELNADQLFVPGSTTKLVTIGTALGVLGPDYRFHTRVYRGGSLHPNGTLKGDLILVAGGDPNLSNRVRSDGALAFENVDHSYSPTPGAKAVPGDPLAVIRELAKQVAAKGVKRIEGVVRVDASLFPEGEKELGTGVAISPMVVNDNVIDVTITPGVKEGAAASITLSPETGYVHLVSHVKTTAPRTPVTLRFTGERSAVLEGAVPLGGPPLLRVYKVPEPSVFAATVLKEALQREGVRVEGKPEKTEPYTGQTLLAEHVSAPLIEEARVTLKVSQNLHASMMPFLVGALGGKAKDNIDQKGFDLEHALLEKAGLDLSAASQSDGAGGSALYTPDFMVHFLAYMAGLPYFDGYYRALPILGKDGTLWDIQVNSPAAGHVHAKTGTYASYNALNKNLIIDGKGLAGYLTTKDGHKLAFAVYANLVPADPEIGAHMVGDALGEIAGAAYDFRFEQ
jgi:D-alanyl-D-alanine carboxypeptidase/D-alanyl-D-alanine-endopeptidase (penicillin-binding protein 4)